MKILVFRIGQLGDSIVALPAIWALREQFRGARLTLLCDWHPGKQYVLGADLFLKTGIFERVEKYPVHAHGAGKSMRFLSFFSLLLRLRSQRFDALAYLAPSSRPFHHVRRDKLFFRAAGIKKFYGIEGFSATVNPIIVRPLQAVEHEADHLLSRLSLSGISVPLRGQGSMDLRLGDDEEVLVRSWLNNLPDDQGKQWVGFGPGSKMPSKKWSFDNYVQVGRELIGRFDIWPVVFGGPEDAETGKALLQQWGRGFNAAGNLTLRAAASALSRCALYVGNDTGTMHLAAAAGTKCVAVFSARDCPGRWDPYGSGHRVLRTVIECEGCKLMECIEKRNECLARIAPRDVIAACADLLDRSRIAFAKAI